ncbi:hypothetical protein [Pseudoxanthomonas sp. X-1]|uniref:hypothetical protein n=1 Tax=Pseudoxanthomonas sp. X-1 TaxID=2571115 RepID=UPI00198050A8|nr:hypothetical protein [Pseudoxanthomonas sp. X-1]UAY74332.1 hypothetical protein LAJ50_18035 [Pseudoxanthomonas sp. X-1]
MTYLLRCYRYIELKPVRAGTVADPADYPWSSHAYKGRESRRTHPTALQRDRPVEVRATTYRCS